MPSPSAAGPGEGVEGGEPGGAGAVVGGLHVGRIQVPVDDAGVMDVVDGLGEARGQLPCAGRRQRAVVAGGRAARCVERGRPGARSVGVRGHDGRGEGAAGLAGGGHLAAGPGAELVGVRVLAAYDLDREPTTRGGAGEMATPSPVPAPQPAGSESRGAAPVRPPSVSGGRGNGVRTGSS
ncbi:hypothetical protein OG866_29155 [Streptomyces sp. NBC_00663]|uniref:hypothetical protein n=1 Tax=Streptomyces sp. NBC_00663 TaxID=2975801 RepID=UPI002E2F6219|nr:hypothetical protein [Streptomyces sp. NBC_00663]